MVPKITSIEWIRFDYPLEDVAKDRTTRKLVYQPGSSFNRSAVGFRVETNTDFTGEYVGGSLPGIAQVDLVADELLGKNPLARERLWTNCKQALRMYDGVGIGPIDIALWDFAGKVQNAPIHELLGTYRERLPAYASTYFGDDGGGFDTPDDYAAFAADCHDIGYPAFKIHPWASSSERTVEREIATIHAVADVVGDTMTLMHDPVCSNETFADALAVGRACDEREYLWLEDPYSDGGVSQHGHRKLRERLDTPLLQTELVRGVEAHADFVATGSTDFVRADVEWDGGITGSRKIAHVAEGFGLDVEFHLPGPAQRHCMAAARNSNYYEIGLVHPDTGRPHVQPPVYAGDYTDQLEAVAEDGTFPVPDGIGLGVDYDWEYIREHERESRVYR